MRFWTVHVRDGRAPELVAERFSLAAMLFGPVWLLWHGAWIAALLLGCLYGLIAVAAGEVVGPILLLGLAWFTGLSGHDLRRWALGRRRFRLAHVVAAADAEAALARVFAAHPDLAAADLPPVRA